MIPKSRSRIITVVLTLICVGFLALSLFVKLDPTNTFDTRFSKEVQEHQNPMLDVAMEVISWFGYSPGSIIMVALGALAFLLMKYKREAAFMLLTALSGVVSTIIKIIINRPRPAEPLVHVFKKAAQQSFPSGHVMFYVVYFGFLTILMVQLKEIPKAIRIIVGIISVFLIFSIPFSRIYLGAHWFTDVLGGALVGTLCLYTLSYFYEKKATKAYENE
ncbi:phosphatase PAP2 family protein [Mucilaginibacter agri]|uniref:Phosphatase PAP2 family protein n=1 Tax=Mucilaginibacter agri TaxID=2695265 RepID=A0A965ZD01_9SPHI|nr:phosphatase PAP2 family protein [Mucilaginibacter agri]NCD68763.1 phosphatase PAP2 family protein [Mucilaginibacter agri]